jgi:hypothetical protein
VRRWRAASKHNAIGHLAPTSPIKQRIVLISTLDTPPAAAVLKRHDA